MVARRRSPPRRRRSWSWPGIPLALRATLVWSRQARAELRVTQLAARLEACPFHLVAGALEVDPCAAVEVGAIRGGSAEARTSPWLAPGAVVRGRWRFAHPFFAELELSGSVPLLRPRFLLVGDGGADQTLWHAPPVALAAAAGAGVMLW